MKPIFVVTIPEINNQEHLESVRASLTHLEPDYHVLIIEDRASDYVRC